MAGRQSVVGDPRKRAQGVLRRRRKNRMNQRGQDHHENMAHRINWPGLMETRKDQGAYRGLMYVLCMYVIAECLGGLVGCLTVRARGCL